MTLGTRNCGTGGGGFLRREANFCLKASMLVAITSRLFLLTTTTTTAALSRPIQAASFVLRIGPTARRFSNLGHSTSTKGRNVSFPLSGRIGDRVFFHSVRGGGVGGSSGGSGGMQATRMNLEGKMIVSVEEALAEHPANRGDGDGDGGGGGGATKSCKFVDGSWFLKDRNGRDEFEGGPRIEGALFFDIDDVCAKPGTEGNPKGLKHMMPPPNVFAAAMDEMNIANDDHIILYGSKGCTMVPRAWFQIRNMGHDRNKIHLMQGSLQDWIDAGGPIEEGSTRVFRVDDLDLSRTPRYRPAPDAPLNVKTREDMLNIISTLQNRQKDDIQNSQNDDEDYKIVDARSADRYWGRVPEPRPGMRLGHMPGSLNLPFQTLLDPENTNRFKPRSELESLLSEAGIDIPISDPASSSEREGTRNAGKVVALCGSGASACSVVVALELCGYDPSSVYVYDGSWSEWGAADDDTPIVKE